MPRPIYTICSRSGAEDTPTGLLSLFHIIEQITIASPPPGGDPPPPFPFRVTSYWMQDEDDDPEQEYEFRIVMRLPSGGRVVETPIHRFHFHSQYRRFISESKLHQVDGPGILLIESGVRPVGSDHWIVQNYPIVLRLGDFAEPDSANDAENAGEPEGS